MIKNYDEIGDIEYLNELPLDIKCSQCGLLRPADVPECPCAKQEVVSESLKKRLRVQLGNRKP